RMRRGRRLVRGDLSHRGRPRMGAAGADAREPLARGRLRSPDAPRRARAGAGRGRRPRRGRAMRRFFAIVGREWRAYFLSPLAYVILAAFLVMNGLIF